MASSSSYRPMAFCEVCFLEDHISWEPQSMDESGRVLMKIVGVDVPEKINTESVETCCMCGAITVAGIFQMMDPDKVYFREEDDLDSNFLMSLDDAYEDEEDY